MGLFQKKPQVSNSAPLYTLGLQKTFLVVGLGNIGKRYDNTRHNIGFAAVDYFIAQQSMSNWIEKKDLKCHLTAGTIGSTRVIVIKPTTFMNLSGEAVQATAHFYKIKPEQIIVVQDELDLDFGQIRVRVGGSSAGHNGVQSIINIVGDNFGRLRIGINNINSNEYDGKDFVLSKFNDVEKPNIKTLLKEVNSIIIECIAGDNLSHETRSFL